MKVIQDVHKVFDGNADATFLHASDVGSGNETREVGILRETLKGLT